MSRIQIRTESHYTVDRKRIREVIEKVLHEKGVKGKCEVSLNIVGNRLMSKLNKKYRHIDHAASVLSFPYMTNGSHPFIEPPDGILRLGDIVISYPIAREQAADENKLVDKKIEELVIHGMSHLLGQNHE